MTLQPYQSLIRYKHWADHGLFRVVADNVKVPLQTITPSGRVWDDKRQLWIEPGRKRTVSISHNRRRVIQTPR